MSKKTAGTQPQSTREYWKSKNKRRGLTKTNNSSGMTQEQIEKHRKKFK